MRIYKHTRDYNKKALGKLPNAFKYVFNFYYTCETLQIFFRNQTLLFR